MSIQEEYSMTEKANLLSRLNRLPSTKSIIVIIVLLAFVWLIEAFDLGIIAQVIVVLKKIWNLSPAELGFLGISSTIGIIIGVYFGGRLCDKFGRKKVLIWGVFMYTFFTLITPLFPNFYWIISMRFLGGLGAGAVFPLPYLMISEFAPPKWRGVMVSYANAVLCAAYALPSLVGGWAISTFSLELAWRVPFIVGGIPIVTVLLLAKWVPESPRWLLEKNRIEDVKKIVHKLEKEAGLTEDTNFIIPAIAKELEAQKTKTFSVSTLFKNPYLSRSLISWGVFTGSMIFWYVMMVFGPMLFNAKGFEIKNAVLFTALLMGVGGLGEVIVGYLSDAFGRKTIISAYCILAAAGCILMALFTSHTILTVGAITAAFFGFGVLPASKVYIAEQYPTYIRGLGVGTGETVVRFLSGVLATYFIPSMVSTSGVETVFWFNTAALIMFTIPLMLWGRETARTTIDVVVTADSKVEQ